MIAALARRRKAPRPLTGALASLTARLEPDSPLARVQRVWPALGEVLPMASEAEPSSLRDGVLTLRCSASVYANELQFLAGDLLAALNGLLGEELVHTLRMRTGG